MHSVLCNRLKKQAPMVSSRNTWRGDRLNVDRHQSWLRLLHLCFIMTAAQMPRSEVIEDTDFVW